MAAPPLFVDKEHNSVRQGYIYMFATNMTKTILQINRIDL